MAISTGQQNTLQIIATLTSCLSILGSLTIIHSLHRSSALRLPTTLDRLVLTMSVLDVFASFFFSLGELPYTVSAGFCTFQGIGVQVFALSTVLFNSCMAHNLYTWIVKKKDLQSLSSNLRYYLLFSVGLPVLLSIILGANSMFGFASLWCWISAYPTGAGLARFFCFYFFVVLAWIFNLLVFIRVNYSLKRRMRKAKAANLTGNQSVNMDSQNKVTWKMQQYLAVFFVVWFFGLLNRTIQDFSDEDVFWALVLHVLFVPLQGFLNAVVYGGLLETKTIRSWRMYVGWIKKKSNSHASNTYLLDDSAPTSIRPPWSQKPLSQKKPLSLFVSTYNLAEKPTSDISNLSDWLPPGHDVYAIGVQECMTLSTLRSSLSSLLGGPSAYTMFTAEIGSTNTKLGFHGMIAVTIFARKSHCDTGAFYMPTPNTTEIKKGANLVVTNAPNKGAVGVPFVMYDASLCFFTGHFAANSKGRNRLQARLDDSRDTLSKAVVTSDDINFDVHLTCHYTFVFGDLNFRCVSSPENVMGLVSEACGETRDGGYGERKGWRGEAYKNLDPGGENKELDDKAMEKWKAVSKLVMSHNEIFTNFEEPGHGIPTFPPSFRRKMGRDGDCGDYTDKKVILGAYTTNVKESKAAADPQKTNSPQPPAPTSSNINTSVNMKLKLGERIPSYTDRILYHALPDKSNDIQPKAYELCDACTSSDHRPVSACFEIYVDESIKRGNAGADASGYNSMEEGGLRYMGTKCNFLLRASKIVLTSSELAQGESDNLNPDSDVASLASEVVIVFPLPTEDPLVEERKVHALASALDGVDQSHSDSSNLNYSSRDGKFRTSIKRSDLWKNDKRVSFKQSSTEEGVEIISECRPELGVHALLKVNDIRGECVGQVVVGFGDYLDRITAGKQVTINCTLEMTLGGKKVGELNAVFNVVEVHRLESLGGLNANVV
ncbi:hypothetical protein TrVE_jg1545 [Triparma verrucosa]|uniref:G-protein coupled receptors family 2 profile 2 domain-containing protein n=1 Tax=Triparma verrucosa TaxID=1606542 RepID=A0A9W7FN01_9STRA|nr:hypothetical protein TrVE_jg1545 [Triparma verrucosa]